MSRRTMEMRWAADVTSARFRVAMSGIAPRPSPAHGFVAEASNQGFLGPTRQFSTWCRCHVAVLRDSCFSANPACSSAVLSSAVAPVAAAPALPPASTRAAITPTTIHRMVRTSFECRAPEAPRPPGLLSAVRAPPLPRVGLLDLTAGRRTEFPREYGTQQGGCRGLVGQP